MKELLWRIGGQSGEGIESSGEVLAGALHRLGYYVYGFREFPSRIRGGHTHYTLRASPRTVRHPGDGVDILLALDQESIDRNWAEVNPDAYVLFDASRFAARFPDDKPVQAIGLPLTEIAKGLGEALLRNVAGVGATTALIGLPAAVVQPLLEKQWGRKGAAVVARNLEALQQGWQALRQIWTGPRPSLPAVSPPVGHRYLLTGNQAVALGALFSGCRFLAAYPITPASEILHELATLLPPLGGVVVQAEDELAALNMAIGAGYAGARAMTSTSGPGFSLMMEALGLAGMAEVPVVLVDVQRAGPSTGMPTKLEQSDLYEAVYGSHGEIPRVVLAPATVEDAFYQTAEAFQLAETYQCPVILLSDAAIGQATQTVENLNLERLALNGQVEAALTPQAVFPSENARRERYPRYEETESGVSARPLPGQPGGIYLATGNEHDRFGRVTDAADNRVRQMKKRMSKLAHLSPPNWVSYTGPAAPDLVLVGWGATIGAITEARQALVGRGAAVGQLIIRGLHPFPRERVEQWLARAQHVLVVEHNYEGQLEHLLRSECRPELLSHLESFRQYNGRLFRVADILRRAETILSAVRLVPAAGVGGPSSLQDQGQKAETTPVHPVRLEKGSTQ